MTSTDQTAPIHCPASPDGWPTADPANHPATPTGEHPAGPVPPRTGLRRVVFGPPGTPSWARPLLWVLLAGTAALYLVDLSASGYANDFYAAAVQSSTQSWKAWLFASLDSGNAITVDKPPAAMWVMGLSVRIFGFSSFAMLLPQALMGVGTVALVHATVRRWSGPAAGLVAGALVALTPVAALMFRFNNPDALLTLLMTAGAYGVVRAIDSPVRSSGRSRALGWLLLAGTAIGFAFLTKMLQGLLVLPAFGLVYLVAAPRALWTRIWQVLAAAGAVVVSAGWFVLLVALWPAESRPYIGGSTDNSLWELAIGYNGLGRIFGQGGGSSGGGVPGGVTPGSGAGFGGGGFGGGFGGQTGLTRMFGTSFGSQIAWLLPAALIGLLAGLWFSRRAARTDRTRAALLLWGGWLLVSAAVFSFMSGIIHPYYSVALAPAIAALVAVSGRELWRGRAHHLARAALALMIAVTALWSWYLLGRDAAGWLPWLRWVVLLAGLIGAIGLAASGGRARRFAAAGLIAGSVAALGGTAAFTVATASLPHTGSIPVAGPTVAAAAGGFGGPGGGFPGGAVPGGGFPGGGFPGGGFPGGGQPGGGPTGGQTGGGQTGAGAAGTGGQPGDSGAAGSELTSLLTATDTRWSAAVIGSQEAAGYILSSGTAVMAIGGWGGSDPSPTLAQFQQYVAGGQISYFIAGGQRGGPGGDSGTGAAITSWVEQHYQSTSVGSATVYDLRKPIAGS